MSTASVARCAPQADALFQVKPEPQFGVLINEVLINCYVDMGNWWLPHRTYWEIAGRLRIHVMSITGDRVELGPMPRKNADFIAEHMVSVGVPKRAVKVQRWIDSP